MTGLLLFGDTERSAALRHEVPVGIMDALMFVELDGRRSVLTALERDRIRRVLPDAELLDFNALGFRDLARGGMSFLQAEREVAVRAARQIGLSEAVVPSDFPLGLAEGMRAAGLRLTVDDEVFALRRRSKTAAELDGIQSASRAAEQARSATRDLLARAQATSDGHLEVGGDRLFAEHVRETVRAECAAAGAHCPPDVMVTFPGRAYGHDPGWGPLPAGRPIVIDLWPQHEETGCWADMTRTFVSGSPRPQDATAIAEYERLVHKALDRVKRAIRPGMIGRELYGLACEVFERAGFPTQRSSSDPQRKRGSSSRWATE